ncbi:MAG: protein-glutamate O-methyltransferase CheR [SAR324 cluster bacterium]|nr:protein-glutamate O-methyltransferase CheR [SAR324 cluster bacterium]
MEPAVFNKFRDVIFESSGIFLTEHKEALVSARIGKRMRVLNITDYGHYLQQVMSDETGGELRELVNAISTNVTHFFRENQHFDFLSGVLRQWSQNGSRQVRIWCAACASGEEPYTIAMTALESLPGTVQPRLIASDISTKVLQIAKFGVYKDSDVQNISKVLLRRYFQKGVGRAADLYRIKQEVRDLVSFNQINLSTPPYPVKGDLDMIFCRNVMIYFNQELRRRLVEHFERLLKAGGYLFVGLAESLSGAHRNLATVEPSVYQKIN